MTYQLINANCLDVLSDLPHVDAVITDPPYGCRNNCDYTRFTNGISPSRNYHRGIKGDDQPFDPSPWLQFPKVVLFGYQYFAEWLPVGTLLVWVKKRDSQLGTFLSDAEIAWQKGGKGVYVHRHIWHGFDRQTERGKSLHPTQKPIEVMRWIIERQKLPAGATILDPYTGSGATGIAAIELGYNFIGIEIDPAYHAIAEQRISQAAATQPLSQTAD